MIIHSPIFSGSITQAESAHANLSGSFSGSFTGVGNFVGLEADSVEFNNILNKPSLVSGSSQVSYPGLSNIPSGIISSSAQIDTLFNIDGLVSGSSQVSYPGLSNIPAGIVSSSAQVTPLLPTGVVSGSSQLVYTSLSSIPAGIVSGSSQITYANISSIPAGIVSSSAQVTPLLPSGVVSGSSQVNADSITNFDTNVKDKLNADGVVSGSSQITYSGISSIPAGIVSGSSQVSYPNLSNIPSGIVSGSSQLSGTTITDLTIVNLTTINETASVIFSSGSNRFGDFGNDTHQFTGSVQISGSLTTIGTSTATSYNGAINATNGVVSGSSQITYASISSIPAGIVSGSAQVTPLLPTGVVSGSSQVVYTSLSSIPVGIVSGSSQIDVASTTGDIALGTRTSGNYVASLVAGTNITLTNNTGEGATPTIGLTNNAITIAGTSTSLGGSITAATILVGTGVVSGSSQIDVASTTGDIALGTRTSGNYVASLVAGTGVTITNNSGEGATPTIAIGQAVATNSEVQFAKVGVGGAHDATYELKVTGDIGATGDIVAYVSSDERLKNNVELISNPIEKVQALRGVTWEWNELASEAAKQSPNVGVIAQEVEKVLPQLVHDRENGFKGVDYAKLTGLLIEAIKEQQKQIDELKSRL